jgi:hypothetical protein
LIYPAINTILIVSIYFCSAARVSRDHWLER